MWVNRSSGDALITTVWADDATMRASEAAVAGLRSESATVLDGVAAVERHQVLHVDAIAANEVGDATRIVRMRCASDLLDAHMLWSQQVLPALHAVSGYRSYVVAVDRTAGTVLGISTYADAQAADLAFTATAPQRTAVVARGTSIDEVTTYEVAIVGIRAPRVAAPAPLARRSLELAAESPVYP
jgi:hypothetical protein